MSDADPSKPSDSKKTEYAEYVHTDDGWQRWKNTFNLVLGRFSDEGVAQYIEGRDDRFEKRDCERCEKFRDSLLQYSQSCPAFIYQHLRYNRFASQVPLFDSCAKIFNNSEGTCTLTTFAVDDVTRGKAEDLIPTLEF